VTLRRRLTLVLVATAVPLVGGLVWLRAEADRRASERFLRDFTQSRIEAIGRERCEAAPADLDRLAPPGLRPPQWRERSPGQPPPGGPFTRRLPAPRERMRARRPMSLYAYDSAYHSADGAAPSFPLTLRAQLDAGSSWVTIFEREGDERINVAALRTSWPGGACSFILARGPAPPRLPREAGFIASALALCAALLTAVWFAVGPVIRRLRSLAHAMRVSAASHYEHAVPVEGADEIASLAKAFNAAGAELRAHLLTVEQREEALRSFLANTTHDVMIPLTVLQGHLSALRQRVTQDAPALREHVDAAVDEASHIGAMVHNLGAAAKLEAGDGIVRRDAVDLNALVERVVERHRPLADPRGISLAFAVPPDERVLVLGDLTLIEQAVGNVIANAVHYNQTGGHVAVSLETTRDEPRRFRLRVVDDGPGVSDEELDRLGQRHFRGRAGCACHPDGQGLGLHIARSVVERHAFELHFERPEGGGLEVRLSGLLSGTQPTLP
jgi:two-component system, OmpR family, sensor histidine kinase BaeS